MMVWRQYLAVASSTQMPATKVTITVMWGLRFARAMRPSTLLPRRWWSRLKATEKCHMTHKAFACPRKEGETQIIIPSTAFLSTGNAFNISYQRSKHRKFEFSHCHFKQEWTWYQVKMLGNYSQGRVGADPSSLLLPHGYFTQFA